MGNQNASVHNVLNYVFTKKTVAYLLDKWGKSRLDRYSHYLNF